VPPRRTITASFPPLLFEQVEQARGLVSRSAWLQRAAEDFLVGRGALEREPGLPTDAPSLEGRSDRAGTATPVSARAPVAQRIEGQTTVDEMLASCPQCAGELQEVSYGDANSPDAVMMVRCEDCGWAREPSDG
jgi:hypothetical protein